MCCGSKRSALRQASPRPGVMPVATGPLRPTLPPIGLRYDPATPIKLRGPVTGRLYAFSGGAPAAAEVDQRDATALLRTGLFSRV